MKIYFEIILVLIVANLAYKQLIYHVYVVQQNVIILWLYYHKSNSYICVCIPVFCSSLITFVTSKDPFVWRGYLLAVLLFILSLFGAIISTQYMFGTRMINQRITSVLTAAIYRKVSFVINQPMNKKHTYCCHLQESKFCY